MDVLLLTMRSLLAVVFVVAGVTKLLDPAGTRQAVSSFGIPAHLGPVVGLTLPFVEIVVAVTLLPKPSAWWGALGAFILLLLFVTAISVSLARGSAPDCHCFGQLYSAPIGRSTLLRNVALGAVAVFVLWQGRKDPGASSIGWIGNLSVAERALLVVVVILTTAMIAEGWVLLHLVRQHGRLLLKIDDLETLVGTKDRTFGVPANPGTSPPGLPIGSVAPAFSLGVIPEGTATLNDLLKFERPVVLVFSDSGCASCTSLLSEIAHWQEACRGLTLAVITRGTVDRNRELLAGHDIRFVLLQGDRETARAYGAHATPSAVMVYPNGTIGSHVMVGPVAIRSLIGPWLKESKQTQSATEEESERTHVTSAH